MTPSDDPDVTTSGAVSLEPKRGALPTVLLIVTGLALIAAAVYYFLSLDAAPPKRPGTTSPASGAGSTASEAALDLPAGVSEDLAKRMYVEQIQSQTNLEKMAAGEITRFDITSVNAENDSAAVEIKATFADRTSGPGVIQLIKRGDSWYVMSLTGLNPKSVSGSAESVNSGTAEQGLARDAEVVAASGITEFDHGAINAMLAAQAEDQEIVSGILGGELTAVELGTPVPGAGTVVVPVNLSGSVAPMSGEAVMITTGSENGDYTFLTSLRIY